MFKKTVVTFLITSSLLVSAASAEEMLAKDIESYLSQNQFPGMVTLVLKNDEVVHFSAIGFNNLEKKSAIQKDHIFRIYSMTKPIVALALLQLVEAGKVHLDADIREYLPALEPFEFADEEVTITVHQLLSHTAGLGYFGGFTSWNDFLYLVLAPNDRDNTTDEMISDVSGIELKHKPGAQWRYSIASDLQGAIIEKVTGQRLEVYLQQHVFKPLGMTETSFIVSQSMAPRLVDMYEYEDQEVDLSELAGKSDYLEAPNLHSGGGGLVSTATDYAKFVQLLLHKGQYQNKRIIGAKYVEMMLSEHTKGMDTWLLPRLYINSGFGYGIGVKVGEQDVRPQGSFFWAGKGGTFFWGDPKNNIVVVGMIQLEDGWRKMDRWLTPKVYQYYGQQ